MPQAQNGLASLQVLQALLGSNDHHHLASDQPGGGAPAAALGALPGALPKILPHVAAPELVTNPSVSLQVVGKSFKLGNRS